jgi:hypothetical protein
VGSIRSLGLARNLGLAALGAASLFVYAWLLPHLTWLSSATWMPVPADLDVPSWLRGSGTPPMLAEGLKAQLHAATAVNVAVGFTSLYVLYLAAARLARGRAGWLGVVIVAGVAVLMQVMAVLAPYALSSDVFSYAMYGRIFAVYGGSPYLEAPIRYATDPFYPSVFWMHVPSFYGPLWTLISGQIALAAGDNIGLAVLMFRLVQAVSALGVAGVVLLLLRRIDPDRALVGAITVAWCPLVVVESGLSSHNDVLMGLLIVVGLVLAWTRRPILSIAAVGAVVLAGLVKLTALALLPLLGIYLLRSASSWGSRLVIFCGSGIVAAALTAAVVLPVWSGPETFAVQALGSGPDRYVNSLAETALGELRLHLGATRDDLEVPLQFSGWWVGVHTETSLYATRREQDVLAPLPVWSELLVVGPERDDRLRVFDPVSRQVGFVLAETLGPIDAPARLMADPEIEARSRGPVGSPDLIEANRLIRLVGWGAFGLAFLVALAFGTGSAASLVVAWVGLCLVLEYVTLTWFWPWYVLWGLLPAALVPRTRVTRLTLYLGWGVLMAYALMGFMDTRFWYLHNYRAVPMFGLPLLLFAADELLRGLVWLATLPVRRSQSPISLEAARRERLSSA